MLDMSNQIKHKRRWVCPVIEFKGSTGSSALVVVHPEREGVQYHGQ
jgi:hypothetical protein